MKRVIQTAILSMLIAIVNISVSSCSKDDYSSPIKGKTVADMTFESTQSSNSITIGDADFTNFTIKSSETWCTASAQGKNLNITVQSNTTYGERQATITVTDPGDQSVVSFKVIQKQNDAILVDGSTFKVPEAGGDISIKVQSNVKYQVEIPSSASWLTSKAATRALENSTISLSAAANNSGDEREAIVKLTNTASGVSSQFTIKQELTPAVSIDVDEIQMDEFGGEVKVTVTSNVAIDVKFSDDWISSAGTTAKDDFGFVQKIKVSPLPSSENSRTSNITFADKLGKWNISKVVPIKQIKSLSIQDDDFEINVGDSYSLKLINNIGGSVKWSSSNTSIATVDNDGKVKGVGGGTATITVTSADGKYSDKVNVTVKQSLSIQDNDLELYIGDSYTLSIDNKTAGKVSWKSSNTSVATVDNSGIVTGVGKGSATITVTSADGTCSDNIVISVIDFSDQLSYFCNAGFESVVTSSGAWSGYFVSCRLTNKSKKNISLIKCDVYKGSTYLDTQNLNSELKAGSSETVKLRSKSGFNGSFTFVWSYTLNGKSYTLKCESPTFSTY